MYDSEIHVDIGWLWDGGIDVSIGNDEVKGHVEKVAEVLPWLASGHCKALSRLEVQRGAEGWDDSLEIKNFPKNAALKADLFF